MQPPAAANRCGSADHQGDRQPNQPLDRSPRRALLLLGASVRAPAQSAQRAGYCVVGVDRFGDRDTLLACERHLLLPPADRIGEAGIQSLAETIRQLGCQMPLVPVGGLQGWQRLLQELPLLEAWPGQREAAEQVRELPHLQEACRGTRFQLPPTFQSSDPALAGRRQAETARWLQKSVASCGGLGTRWWDSAISAQLDPSRVEPPKQTSTKQWVQQWVAGRLFGATLLSNGREVALLGVCRSLFTRKGHFPFVYCGSLGPIEIPEDLREELDALARRVVESTHLRGLFTIDFLREPAGRLWLLEINPRWSGSSELIERCFSQRQPDVSLARWMIGGLDGRPLPKSAIGGCQRSQDITSVYLKRIVFARRDYWFDPKPIESMLGEGETLHDLPGQSRRVQRGEPVCTLITELSGKEKDPMRRHRVLVDHLAGIRDR